MPSLEQYYNAIPNLKSPDVEKRIKGLSVIEGLGGDGSFQWKKVKCDKWAALVSEICQIITVAVEDAVCNKALICANHLIKKSELTHGQIRKCMMSIYSVGNKQRKLSHATELEALRTIESLLDTFPMALSSNNSEWLHFVLVRTVHPNPQVRRLALHIFLERKSLLQQNEALLSPILVLLKDIIVPNMKKLIAELSDIDTLKLWGGIIYVLGELLHNQKSLTNVFLEVIEHAFKSSSDVIVQGAYEAWKEMIDNFSLHSFIINSKSRLALLLKPLIYGEHMRCQELFHAKVLTWWYLAYRLGPNLHEHFEKVVLPLFEICFGDPTTQIKCKDMTGEDDSWASVRTAMGVNIVARLFEAQNVNPGEASKCFMLDPLKRCKPLVPSIFITYHKWLLHAAVKMLQTDIPNESKLILYIWKCLMNAYKTTMDSNLIKEYFRALEHFSEIKIEDSKLLFEIIELSSSFPTNILHTHICSSREDLQRSLINSTPALMMSRIMFGINFAGLVSQKKFSSLFKLFISFSTYQINSILEICLSTYSLIEKASNLIRSSDEICKLWQVLTMQLITSIESSQDVNQGNSLQHDFSCVQAALIFPFKQLTHWTYLSAVVKKTTWKRWDQLYLLSVKCAAVIPNVNYNLFTYELTSKMKTTLSSCKDLTMEVVEYYLHAILLTLDNIKLSDEVTSSHFNDLSNAETGRRDSLSRKYLKQLFVINPTLAMIFKITEAIIAFDEASINAPQKNNRSGFSLIIIELIQAYKKILERLSGREKFRVFLQLTPRLVHVFTRSSIENSVFAEPKSVSELESVWLSITQSIAASYSGVCNSSVLMEITPLLELAFTHSRKAIQTATWTFWHSTFNSCFNKLTIPNRLKCILEKLKPKLFSSPPSRDIINDNAFNDSPRTPISAVVDSASSLQSLTPIIQNVISLNESDFLADADGNHNVSQFEEVQSLENDFHLNMEVEKEIEVSTELAVDDVVNEVNKEVCSLLKTDSISEEETTFKATKRMITRSTDIVKRRCLTPNHKESASLKETSLQRDTEEKIIKNGDLQTMPEVNGNTEMSSNKLAKSVSATDLPLILCADHHLNVVAEVAVENILPTATNAIPNQPSEDILNSTTDDIEETKTSSVSCESATPSFLLNERSSPVMQSPNGILKRKNESPSLSKRRVSFADPLVQDETTVPTSTGSTPLRSPNVRLINRRGRKMKSSSTCNGGSESLCKEESTESDSGPIMADLVNCSLPVSSLLPYLDVASTKGFMQLLNSKSIITVGDFAKLSNLQIQSLPLLKPKLEVARLALQQLRDVLSPHNKFSSEEDVTCESSPELDSIVLADLGLTRIENSNSSESTEKNETVETTLPEKTDLTELVVKKVNICPSSSMSSETLANIKMEIKCQDADTQTEKSESTQETQTCVKTVEIAVETNAVSKCDNCVQTTKMLVKSQNVQTNELELLDREVQTVTELSDADVQTNFSDYLKNVTVQTEMKELKDCQTDTHLLIDFENVECQTTVDTMDMEVQTSAEVLHKDTQTKRGIDPNEEDPFEYMFNSFSSSLESIEVEQFSALNLHQSRRFQQNMFRLLDKFTAAFIATHES